jgi:hypothetical protein
MQNLIKEKNQDVRQKILRARKSVWEDVEKLRVHRRGVGNERVLGEVQAEVEVRRKLWGNWKVLKIFRDNY